MHFKWTCSHHLSFSTNLDIAAVAVTRIVDKTKIKVTVERLIILISAARIHATTIEANEEVQLEANLAVNAL